MSGRHFKAVDRALVGDNRPGVRPGDQDELFGTATLSPDGPAEVRTYRTFTVTYTVGKLGIDDTGGIRLAWRWITDAGVPQMTGPKAPNYVTASSNGEGRLNLRFDNSGFRPFTGVLTVTQRGGYLRPGEQIEITLGDTSAGSPGMLTQTFIEGGRDFVVMADIQATGNFQELPGPRLYVPMVAGPVARWLAVLPTLRRPGEVFHLGIKAEDRWGNPSDRGTGRLTLHPSQPIDGLPETIDFPRGEAAITLEGLSVAEPGTVTVEVRRDGESVAHTGPLTIEDGPHSGYWADLHGQSGETVGTNTIEHYFDFARNRSFLDAAAHQGNDFQITPTFWKRLNALTAELDQPGRFTVFPGYEWSGNTAVGGDHNVYFRTEGRPIRRCSHALLEDRSEIATDAHTLTDLFRALREAGEDAVMYAHVGGRYADIFYDHDPVLETAVELHSAWGTFEWILTDGFPIGRRVGVVCNSDGHKGRPGSSHPGASIFGAYGGLTCFLTTENARDAIFEAMRRRHHYGTTGARIYLDVRASLASDSTLFHRNPDAVPDTSTETVRTAMMGDIVRTADPTATFDIRVKTPGGIHRLELRRGTEVLETVYSFGEAELGHRIRVLCHGAEYRGRGRNTFWHGRARLSDAEITRMERINHFNLERPMDQDGVDGVIWESVTTGNFSGFDIWVDRLAGALELATNRGTLTVDLATLGQDPVTLEAGGLERRMTVCRLPDEPLPREIEISRTVPLAESGDSPLWFSLYTEDGHQAWPSPIYMIR